MKEREVFAEIRAPLPLIIRVDGRNFHRFLEKKGFQKPYDKRFAEAMANATELFFKKSGFHPELAYIFSDEVSFFFRTVPFNGRVEKLDSVVASFFSSAFTIIFGADEPLSFDARVIPICEHELVKYLAWRQAEAWRNHVNAYGYYTLRREGLSGEEAQKMLRGMKASEIHEFLFSKGINVAETPAWQRRGILVAWEKYEKVCFDARSGKNTRIVRKKLVQLWDIPIFKTEEGRALLTRLLK
ncbi:tRNA(His) guanylyltransferase Thg1 family protein [Candidatus Alkanophaga liquidiphilum]|nr:tRNA 5'-end guanylyltransferase [Candidatus Alkanophaga liquidiphilum]RLG39128.1 MAG: tRNA 5'-guanylyltransferase [Candidatus Alkanophagales archaeon]